ncbi:hypothetical protein K466DRAFT_591621 [Polyporus arcularius HHB13444]|uniref:F-box domain-containing protein n=1 Tax=Polyporus arcularius HHB13444 TaxID=1314778 RepID=A0A5C3NU20_9APHY|nr:hypothetical protein K466DRAFT_591621 [Polyporus arcularius HHB13444]
MDVDGAAPKVDDEQWCEGLASVTSFTYDVRMAGVPPGYPAEVARQALAVILRGLAPSLETLCLPSIYAPVEIIRDTHWPLLRDFTVRGGHLDTPSASLAYAQQFRKMPKLRALNLEIAQPHVAWPARHVAPFPWPLLEHLTLSHPDPDDAIYAHLPSSIRSLSLHSWPSQVYDVYLQEGTMSYSAWSRLPRGVPFPSSVMLRVVQACSHIASDLTRLHIEYLADENEDALLQYIASACISLAELEIHRRCPDNTPQVYGWYSNLGKACASLTKLRTLYVQTPLNDYPKRVHIPRIARYYTEYQHRAYAERTLLRVATALACMLPPSVETIAFLTPDNFWPRWAVYSVHDAADGNNPTVEVLNTESPGISDVTAPTNPSPSTSVSSIVTDAPGEFSPGRTDVAGVSNSHSAPAPEQESKHAVTGVETSPGDVEVLDAVKKRVARYEYHRLAQGGGGHSWSFRDRPPSS